MWDDLKHVEVTRNKNTRWGYTSTDVTDGPQRWRRAQEWAEKKPDHWAAKMYRARVARGRAVEAELRDMTWPLVLESAYDNGHVYSRHYVCSVMCAAMRLQINHSLTVPGLVATIRGERGSRDDREYRYGVKVRRAEYKRAVKCKACGVQINKDGTQTVLPPAKVTELPEPAPQPPARTMQDKIEWGVPGHHRAAAAVAIAERKTVAELVTEKHRYVLIDGNFVPLTSVRVVELSLEDHHMLTRYSTPALRAEYARNLGFPLAEA